MLIAPSILAADFLHLAKDVETINAYGDWIHLDIMDGSLVPNISFGFSVVDAVAKIAQKPMDVHLMIVNPQKYVERFAKTGASYISFHYEATLDETDTVIDLIHNFNVKAGLAINPDCPVEKIFPYLGKLDYVLVMSVFAGFGGQKFIPETFDRVRAVRKELERIGHNSLIQVDGGVTVQNAAEVAAAGVDVAVAGSAVFKAEDPCAAVAALRGCNPLP